VLLLGNGINRVKDGGVSWREVIRRLAHFVGKVETITRYLDEKPFTLVFEEIFFRAARARGISEDELKSHAAQVISEVPGNDMHTMAVESSADAILTTNYDYNFENASVNVFGDSETRETRYSVYRRRCNESLCIWHIHGEVNYPGTLVLGHDHYADYINQLKKKVNEYETFEEPGADRSSGKMNGRKSWVGLFLSSDVHMISLGLDYTEIELWWLLSVKERLLLRGYPVGSTSFYPTGEKKTRNDLAKQAILESFGVSVDTRFSGLPYRVAYAQFFEYFSAL
jgi:hypothetical protein